MNKKKIIKNAIKCNHCGDVIESKHTHDFKWCSCKTVSVDGGLSYCKRSFKNSPNDYIELMEYEEIKKDKPVDYTIVSKPSYIMFVCPHCESDAQVPWEAVDFNTDYWGDGAWTDCPYCGEEIELGSYDYD